jgi:hypothetical protein
LSFTPVRKCRTLADKKCLKSDKRKHKLMISK